MDLLIKTTIQNISAVMPSTHVTNISNYETATYLTYGRTYFNNETGKMLDAVSDGSDEDNSIVLGV